MKDRPLPKHALWLLFLVLAVQLSACAGMQAERSKQSALKEQQAGRIEQGTYVNDYYKVRLSPPKGWSVGRSNAPGILIRFLSPDKLGEIDLQVLTLPAGGTMDSLVSSFMASSPLGYQLVESSERRAGEHLLRLCVLDGVSKVGEIRALVALAISEQTGYVVECRALRPYYANILSWFNYSIESLRLLTPPPIAQPEETKPTPPTEQDYFRYVVKPDETLAMLAARYLHDPANGAVIAQTNNIGEATAWEEISIPRYVEHVVTEGETFDSLAQEYLRDPALGFVIREYNSLDTDLVVEQQIRIPLYSTHLVEEGESLTSLGWLYYGSAEGGELLADYNNIASVKPGDRVKVCRVLPRDEFIVHRVQSGDTLAAIAAHYTGTSRNYEAIAQYNGIEAPYTLVVGQEIRIPLSLLVTQNPPQQKPGSPRTEAPPPPASPSPGPIYDD